MSFDTFGHVFQVFIFAHEFDIFVMQVDRSNFFSKLKNRLSAMDLESSGLESLSLNGTTTLYRPKAFREVVPFEEFLAGMISRFTVARDRFNVPEPCQLMVEVFVHHNIAVVRPGLTTCSVVNEFVGVLVALA